jgi:hypothetical protein
MGITVTIPYRNTDNDAIQCIYFGIHNPLNVKVERKDFAVIDTQDNGSGKTQINITGTLPALTVDGYVFCNIGTFGSGVWGNYKVISNTSGAVVIDLAFSIVLTGGYINLTTDRPNYYIYTQMQSQLPTILDIDGLINYITRKDLPDTAGVAVFDAAVDMRSKFTVKNNSTYLNLNEEDAANCVIYALNCLEVWDGSSESFTTGGFIGAVNGALQIQNHGGSNMQLYLPTEAGNQKAKLLTDSSRLRRWEGLPFDIHGILGFDVVDGTNAPYLSTHEVEYSSGIVGTVTDTPLTGITFASQLIHRFIMQGGYAPSVDRVNFSINYVNGIILYTNITEELQIRIEHSIPCNPVYLHWLNKKGGYNYWCFGRRQQMGKKTSSEGESEKSFDDLELQDTTSSFISKNSESYMIAGAERLDVYDMLLMDSLTDSPKVMMLMNVNTWASDGPVWQEVKIITDDFKMRETKKTFNNFEVKIRLAETFIQGL